jgi:hypothetical protein
MVLIMNSRRAIIVIGVLTVASTLPAPAEAVAASGQTTVGVRPVRRVYVGPIYWGWYTPHHAITARIYAQAELIRAHGAAAVDFAAAREIHADAVRKEIANSIEFVEAFWKRKSIWEAEMLKRRGTFLGNQKRRNAKRWDRIKNHPELNGPNIVNGRALNFLLHRLSANVLAFQLSAESESSDPAAFKELTLSEAVLGGINLREADGGGVFRATEGTTLNVDWWPYVLRSEEFAKERQAFEKARAGIIAEAATGDPLPAASLQDIEGRLLELGRVFYRKYAATDWRRENIKTHRQYKSGETFLQSLHREIERLQDVGDAKFLRGRSPFVTERDGASLIALLTFLARNGYEFAPATPGCEPAYHTVFAMMRDLYATAADERGEQEDGRKQARQWPQSALRKPCEREQSGPHAIHGFA